MRILNTKFMVVMILLSIATQSFALSSKKINDYYIQLGSYSIKSNAERSKEIAKRHTHYPVTVHRIQRYYVVKVGPLHSVAEVNKARNELTLPTHKYTQSKISTHKLSTHQNSINTPVQPFSSSHQANNQPTAYPVANNKMNDPVRRYKNDMASSSGTVFIAGYGGTQRPTTDNHFTVNNGSGFPYPYDQDQYSRTIHSSASAAAEVGYRWVRDTSFFPAYALSVRYQHIFDDNIGNQVTQYSLPEFDNYSYNWNVSSDIISLIGKLDLAEWGRVMPYISGGFGIAFNHATGFNETAYPGVTPRTSPGFRDYTATQFAYQLGLGVDFKMSNQLLLSLGYDYQNLKAFSSDQGVSSWAGTTLSSSKFHTNTVMLGLTYLVSPG